MLLLAAIDVIKVNSHIRRVIYSHFNYLSSTSPEDSSDIAVHLWFWMFFWIYLWNRVFSHVLSGYRCTVAGLCEQGKGPQGAPSTDRPAVTELGDRNGEATPGGDAALSGKA